MKILGTQRCENPICLFLEFAKIIRLEITFSIAQMMKNRSSARVGACFIFQRVFLSLTLCFFLLSNPACLPSLRKRNENN